MKTVVVNFVAGPGVGKSLMSALIYSELKMMNITAEYVQEYAKLLVWQERFEELNNQYLVSTKQYKMLKAVDKKVDVICTDSPLLLGLLYNKTYKTNVSNIEKTEAMILTKMEEFNNIYIFLERMDYPYETQGRVHNEIEARIIDKQLKELLENLGIEHLTVKSQKNSIQEIMSYVFRNR
jgi:hypothetical protein